MRDEGSGMTVYWKLMSRSRPILLCEIEICTAHGLLCCALLRRVCKPVKEEILFFCDSGQNSPRRKSFLLVLAVHS